MWGVGPGTVSLAVLDFCFQVLYAYAISDIEYPFDKPMKFNFILIDPSPYCLLKTQSLITDYFQHILKKYGGIEDYLDIQPQIITLKGEYPDVLSEIQSIIDFTGKSNLVCFSNVLVQIRDKCICSTGKKGLCPLCNYLNTRKCEANKKIIDSLNKLTKFIDMKKENSFVMILQEKNNAHLIDPILPNENLKSFIATMKQKNYSIEYSNSSYETQYGRAIYYWPSKK